MKDRVNPFIAKIVVQDRILETAGNPLNVYEHIENKQSIGEQHEATVALVFVDTARLQERNMLL